MANRLPNVRDPAALEKALERLQKAAYPSRRHRPTCPPGASCVPQIAAGPPWKRALASPARLRLFPKWKEVLF